MEQLMAGMENSIYRMHNLSLMRLYKESNGETVLLDYPKDQLTLIHNHSILRNAFTSIFLTEDGDGGYAQSWTHTVSGNQEILKSPEIHRFFTSFEINK